MLSARTGQNNNGTVSRQMKYFTSVIASLNAYAQLENPDRDPFKREHIKISTQLWARNTGENDP